MYVSPPTTMKNRDMHIPSENEILTLFREKRVVKITNYKDPSNIVLPGDKLSLDVSGWDNTLSILLRDSAFCFETARIT